MAEEHTPDSLRPGSLVGPWRVEGYGGRGAYGVVYRARRAGHPSSVPVALKLALFAYDPRALREVELLTRGRHPSVPQMVDRGWWHSSEGCMHPYVVMEWINGAPLYEWARVHNPAGRQVLQVVAQVAWGLEVLHRSEGVHRDVKGDNILVEPDGRAFLTDFGSGTWRGAPSLTETLMPPGTREYRGPEAIRFQWKHLRDRDVHYEARTYDDIYALGVAAYRLVTGRYPPPGTDPEARLDSRLAPLPPREPPRVLNPRVPKELSELIERMLSAEPEARGLAREVAEAAEIAAERAGPEADIPLMESLPVPVAVGVPVRAGVERAVSLAGQQSAHAGAVVVPVRVSAGPAARPSDSEPWARASVRVLAKLEAQDWRERVRPVVVVGGLVLVTAGIWWTGHGPHAERRTFVQAEEVDEAGVRADEPASLADASVTTSVSPQDSFSAPGAIALQMPDDPLPGQLRAPCRRRGVAEINGGCWIPWTTISPPCGDGAYHRTYEWKGACYEPIYESGRSPTSKKPQ